MPNYLIGTISAFLSPIQDAWAVILDSYLSNRIFERISSLIFLSSTFSVLVLPFVWIGGHPHLLPAKLIGIVAIISLIEVLYQFPYYWSFRKADTSVVTCLFSIGGIIVPVFAYLIVKERLSIVQYAGYLGITICAAFLAFDWKKFRLNQAAWLMLGVSVMLSLQEVLYKYCFEHGADWATVMTWSSVIQFFFAGMLVLGPTARKDLGKTFISIKSVGPLVMLMQLLTWGGEATDTYALSLIPASVASGIENMEPIFVLVFAAFFIKKKPELFREQLGGSSIFKKVLLFVFMAIGAVLVVLGGK